MAHYHPHPGRTVTTRRHVGKTIGKQPLNREPGRGASRVSTTCILQCRVNPGVDRTLVASKDSNNTALGNPVVGGGEQVGRCDPNVVLQAVLVGELTEPPRSPHRAFLQGSSPAYTDSGRRPACSWLASQLFSRRRLASAQIIFFQMLHEVQIERLLGLEEATWQPHQACVFHTRLLCNKCM